MLDLDSALKNVAKGKKRGEHLVNKYPNPQNCVYM